MTGSFKMSFPLGWITVTNYNSSLHSAWKVKLDLCQHTNKRHFDESLIFLPQFPSLFLGDNLRCGLCISSGYNSPSQMIKRAGPSSRCQPSHRFGIHEWRVFSAARDVVNKHLIAPGATIVERNSDGWSRGSTAVPLAMHRWRQKSK